MKKILLTGLIITLCFTATTFAQDDAAMKSWQTYMTPSDVHKMIAKYDGTWNGTITMWFKPGAPPTVSNGVTVNEMILSGLYQQAKIKSSMMGMPFEGFSLLGYDNLKKVFTSTWIDNFGSGTITLLGTWDDASKTITFTGKEFDPMSGKDMDVKETLQFIDDNTEKFEMFIESPNGEFKTMQIDYTRAK